MYSRAINCVRRKALLLIPIVAGATAPSAVWTTPPRLPGCQSHGPDTAGRKTGVAGTGAGPSGSKLWVDACSAVAAEID
jgi:hypothetical protein